MNENNQLDSGQASRLLDNILVVCDQEPPTVPMRVVNPFALHPVQLKLGLWLSILTLIYLLLFPLSLVTPTIVVTRDSASNYHTAVYSIHTAPAFAVKEVTASLNNIMQKVLPQGMGRFVVNVEDNGTLAVSSTLINGQTNSHSVPVGSIDKAPPEMVSFLSQGGFDTIVIQDLGSGVNFSHLNVQNSAGISITPHSLDTKSGTVTFVTTSETYTILVPDNADNVLKLVLSTK